MLLEHQKIMIRQIGGNKALFKKELQKSLQWLNEGDLEDLKGWVRENYHEQHADIISEVFKDP
jgi:hypothetical protein